MLENSLCVEYSLQTVVCVGKIPSPVFPPDFCDCFVAPLMERRLMDVKLRELPAWLAACDFSPKGLLGAVQKGEPGSLASSLHVNLSGA